MGHSVTLADDNAVTGDAANGHDLVLVSATVNSGAVGNKFRDVAVPAVIWESYVFDDFAMADAGDFGFTAGQDSMEVLDSSHPIGAGLAPGLQAYTTVPDNMRWARPAGSAAVIATQADDSAKATVFAYDAGDEMVGYTAPARRVGLMLDDESPANWTTNGLQIFRNAVGWALMPAVNGPPLVEAGEGMTTFLGTSLDLVGSVSDDGVSGALDIVWSQTSGPDGGVATFADVTDPTTSVAFSLAGSYELVLTADDGEFVASDAVVVEVLQRPANTAPTVDAGEDLDTTAGSSINLQGVVTDDGIALPLSITWTVTGAPAGGVAILSESTALDTAVTFDVPGVYELTLTVSDPEFAVADAVLVTVIAPVNRAPVVSAGPDLSTSVGQTLNLSGTVDDDGILLPLVVNWQVLTEPVQGAALIADPSITVTDVTFNSAGEYTLQLSASDPEFTVSDTVNISISEMPSGKSVLFVASSLSPRAGDLTAILELESMGFNVTLADDNTVGTADALGKDMIVISSSVGSGAVGTKFRDSDLPVVTWESYLFDDFGLVGSEASAYGFTREQVAIEVLDSTHPIAAGVAPGVQTYTTVADNVRWGRPGPTASVIALEVSGDNATVFAYDAGAQLSGLIAPARRVGLMLDDQTPANWTEAGRSLFRNAMLWSSETTEIPEDDRIRILPLGDSITRSTGGTLSYRYYLFESLIDDSCRINFVGTQNGPSGVVFDADNEGHRGYTTGDILLELDEWQNQVGGQDVALIHLGTNDVLSTGIDLLDAKENYRAIIARLRATNPGISLFIAKIINGARLDPLRVSIWNMYMEELWEEENSPASPVFLVDQFTGYEDALHNQDELHPNEAGERLMAERWFGALRPTINAYCQ